MRYTLLATFGLIGVFARYLVNSVVGNYFNFGFPTATIVINVLGSFLIGLAYVVGMQSSIISDDMRVAVMAGLLGGFTTFSAFSLDSVSLFTEGRYAFGCFYVLSNVGGGIGATVCGMYLGKRLFSIG